MTLLDPSSNNSDEYGYPGGTGDYTPCMFPYRDTKLIFIKVTFPGNETRSLLISAQLVDLGLARWMAIWNDLGWDRRFNATVVGVFYNCIKLVVRSIDDGTALLRADAKKTAKILVNYLNGIKALGMAFHGVAKIPMAKMEIETIAPSSPEPSSPEKIIPSLESSPSEFDPKAFLELSSKGRGKVGEINPSVIGDALLKFILLTQQYNVKQAGEIIIHNTLSSSSTSSSSTSSSSSSESRHRRKRKKRKKKKKKRKRKHKKDRRADRARSLSPGRDYGRSVGKPSSMLAAEMNAHQQRKRSRRRSRSKSPQRVKNVTNTVIHCQNYQDNRDNIRVQGNVGNMAGGSGQHHVRTSTTNMRASEPSRSPTSPLLQSDVSDNLSPNSSSYFSDDEGMAARQPRMIALD